MRQKNDRNRRRNETNFKRTFDSTSTVPQSEGNIQQKKTKNSEPKTNDSKREKISKKFLCGAQKNFDTRNPKSPKNDLFSNSFDAMDKHSLRFKSVSTLAKSNFKA